jgi:hypothetical protein
MSTHSQVGWTERFDESSVGVDHLGMRLAGESAYGSLLDFTTTVTWRPRYFSMLCWLCDTAFREAGGRRGEVEYHLNPTRYLEVRGRRERALAAATLLANDEALRIIGSSFVHAAIHSAEAQGVDTPLDASGSLSKVPESYATYAGPMIRLGLLEIDQKIVRPQEGRGLALAQAFERSLLAGGAQSLSLLDSERLPRKALEELGLRCGLAQLASASSSSPEVAAEREALRELLLDWASFEGGQGPSSRRILSIGLILKLHYLAAEADDIEVTLSHFRQATLLDGVRFSPGYTAPFEPDEAYAPVHAQWRMYQGHAYATYACESLLAYVLGRAMRLQAQHPTGTPIPLLLETFAQDLAAGGAKNPLPTAGFESWWQEPLTDVMARMEGIVAAGRSAAVTEAEWMERLDKVARKGRGTEFGHWAQGAAWMLLLTLARLKRLLAQAGKGTWKGETDPLRLPPSELVDKLDTACKEGLSAQAFLRDWLQRQIILQHQRNGLRKLAADPKRDTLKFELTQERLLPFELHDPGTTNPRFVNSVLFLQDLGYLSVGKAPRLTADGEELLARIARESRS